MVTLRNRLHVDHTNVDVTLTGDATSGAALVTTPSNGTTQFIANHSNMQIGSSTLPVGKSNPKVCSEYVSQTRFIRLWNMREVNGNTKILIFFFLLFVKSLID